MRKFLTNSGEETAKLGEDFSKNLKNGDVILLTGNLGSGKTTFVQGIAKGLGIKDRILSPTFVLVRIHEVDSDKFEILNHIDLYRIDNSQEIEKLGIGEFISAENSVTIIEWAEKLLNFTPKSGYRINFFYLGDEQREITIEEI